MCSLCLCKEMNKDDVMVNLAVFCCSAPTDYLLQYSQCIGEFFCSDLQLLPLYHELNHMLFEMCG